MSYRIESDQEEDSSEGSATDHVDFLHQQNADGRAKLEWLRSAARESFASIDRGEGIEFGSIDELEASIIQSEHEVTTDRQCG